MSSRFSVTTITTSMQINTNKDAIEEFLSRGVENIFPNKEFLREKMSEGRQLSMYYGIDPTGPTIHIGHIVPILKLAAWQALGHRAIFLIGDFTAMIGDPTDKLATRKKLSRDEVAANLAAYKKQASSVINFGGDNPVELKFNSQWLSKMNFSDVLELMSNFTHAQMIKRDMFQKRIEEGKDLYMHEIMYPMMQGYDSVVMKVDGEVGGNDQTFNMLAGRDLMKKLNGSEKFVLAMKLLVDPSGKKMGKTEGNMIALSDTPEEMFSKVMMLGDGLISSAFESCTRVPFSEITRIQKELDAGANPRDVKMKLAHEIVRMYHGESAAQSAQDEFVSVFQKGLLPQEMPEFSVSSGTQLSDVLVPALIPSKGEFKRLVDGEAMYFEEEKITSYNFVMTKSGVVRWSKHFARITVQ